MFLQTLKSSERNVDVYPEKPQVLATLCVQLISISVLIPVFLFQIWAPDLMAHLQPEGFWGIPPLYQVKLHSDTVRLFIIGSAN